MQAHEKSDADKRALIQAKLPGFLEGIMAIIPGCKSSVLGMLLESLTTIITVSSFIYFIYELELN